MNRLNIEEAANEYPNNHDLGRYLRSVYQNVTTSEIYELINEYPNDFDLGSAGRDLALTK